MSYAFMCRCKHFCGLHLSKHKPHFTLDVLIRLLQLPVLVVQGFIANWPPARSNLIEWLSLTRTKHGFQSVAYLVLVRPSAVSSQSYGMEGQQCRTKGRQNIVMCGKLAPATCWESGRRPAPHHLSCQTLFSGCV